MNKIGIFIFIALFANIGFAKNILPKKVRINFYTTWYANSEVLLTKESTLSPTSCKINIQRMVDTHISRGDRALEQVLSAKGYDVYPDYLTNAEAQLAIDRGEIVARLSTNDSRLGVYRAYDARGGRAVFYAFEVGAQIHSRHGKYVEVKGKQASVTLTNDLMGAVLNAIPQCRGH